MRLIACFLPTVNHRATASMLPWVIMPAVATGGTKQCGSTAGDRAVFSQQDILHFQFAVCQSRTSAKCLCDNRPS